MKLRGELNPVASIDENWVRVTADNGAVKATDRCGKWMLSNPREQNSH